MASNQIKTEGGPIDRLILAHPRSLGMSWAKHAGGAVRIGSELVLAGMAAFVHAVIPGLFTDTAGKVVTRTYNYIQRRKAASPTPENWSDYDI
jgi:uncharacterized protein DUF6356